MNEQLRYPVNLLEFPVVNNDNSGGDKFHPTQKPVSMFEYFIKTYTNEGDLALDNCAGSGTSGIACQNLKRNYILIENNEKYFNICKSRLLQNWNRVKPA
jgi:site-specific DNA-methyltransferase (adenine-specific)